MNLHKNYKVLNWANGCEEKGSELNTWDIKNCNISGTGWIYKVKENHGDKLGGW